MIITMIKTMGSQSRSVILPPEGMRGGVGLSMLEVKSVGSAEVGFTAF